MQDSNDVHSGFTTGLLMGTTLGAVAALLLAPKPGREMRREITEGGERIRDRVRDASDELKSRGERAVDQTRKTAEEASQGMKSAARIMKEG